MHRRLRRRHGDRPAGAWARGCRSAVLTESVRYSWRICTACPAINPSVETTLRPDELITEIVIPANAFAGHTAYIKVRDRATFEWPVVSAAVGLDMDGSTIRAAHVAAGGVGTKPWRLRPVEKALAGRTLNRDTVSAAAQLSVEGAMARGGTSFKLKLLPHVVERAILTAGGQA